MKCNSSYGSCMKETKSKQYHLIKENLTYNNYYFVSPL